MVSTRHDRSRLATLAAFVAVWIGAGTPVRAPAQSTAPPSARHATLNERHHSGMHGDVTLIPRGKKTEVRLHLASAKRTTSTFTLHSGRDCLDALGPPARAIALSPPGGANNTSKTLVSVPLDAIGSKHYVVDVRNATRRAAFAEACARL